jgi:uncharacterized protein (DUF58 family)
MRRTPGGEWVVLGGGLVLAGIGWGLHLTLLALAGTLTAASAAALLLWQHQCLAGVTYRRTLSQRRATFGEEVALDVEFVNDKLLPLTWLQVEDSVPTALTIRGGTVTSSGAGGHRQLHHLLPMLPFQRVRRHLTVVCDRRGEHRFGPATLVSGDPVGLRQQTHRVADEVQLLVYPKLFRLVLPPVASRLSWGDQRAGPDVAEDPSRVAGVRPYRPGDPLRHVDWRATARRTSLLVREFEPTATWRVAVFADVRVPGQARTAGGLDATEFLIAVTASVIAELARRGVATGLYSSGTVRGNPIGKEPSASPEALRTMLEALALMSPYGRTSIAELLLRETARLRAGASLVIVATDFSGPTLAALTNLRRRWAVTALWVSTTAGRGRPPGSDAANVVREVKYHDDWQTDDILQFSP